MKILISKNDAVARLSARLGEARALVFTNVKAWQSRTVADVHDIFPVTDHRYSEINLLYFPTQDVGVFFNDAKNNAIGLLGGYIHYINQHVPDDPIPVPAGVIDYKTLYQIELQKANEFGRLLTLCREAKKTAEKNILDQTNSIRGLESKIASIEDLTIWGLVVRYKKKGWWLVCQLVLAASFFCYAGVYYQTNRSNVEMFDIKAENIQLKKDTSSLRKKVNSPTVKSPINDKNSKK